MNVGIVGCGMISDWYFRGAKRFAMIDISACADLDEDLARRKGALYGIPPVSVDRMLADPNIELVVNLTPPQAHVAVSRQILLSGKHVYSEKPLALDLSEAEALLALAESKNLRVGCAPDSFFGGAHQALRQQVERGAVGDVLTGTVMAMSRGPEKRPNAPNHFGPGGGPMLDIGPYYVTTLIHTLGPVKRVTGFATKFSDAREGGPDTVPAVYPVAENTHYCGVLEYASGALVTCVASYDVHAHTHPCIELYGTEGGLQMTNPVFFQGAVKACAKGSAVWRDVENPFSYNADARGIGVADMIESIRVGRKHRAAGELARHALEIMRAFDDSSRTGKSVTIQSTCERPPPLAPGLADGEIA